MGVHRVRAPVLPLGPGPGSARPRPLGSRRCGTGPLGADGPPAARGGEGESARPRDQAPRVALPVHGDRGRLRRHAVPGGLGDDGARPGGRRDRAAHPSGAAGGPRSGGDPHRGAGARDELRDGDRRVGDPHRAGTPAGPRAPRGARGPHPAQEGGRPLHVHRLPRIPVGRRHPHRGGWQRPRRPARGLRAPGHDPLRAGAHGGALGESARAQQGERALEGPPTRVPRLRRGQALRRERPGDRRAPVHRPLHLDRLSRAGHRSAAAA